MCGVSHDRCMGFSLIRWLFGGCMFGVSHSVCATAFVVLGDARPFLLSPCTTNVIHTTTHLHLHLH